MIGAFRKIAAFRNVVSNEGSIRRSRVYHNRAIGIRSPDSPIGLLLQENSIIQFFAGANKIVGSPSDGILVSASYFGYTGSQFQINVPSPRSVKVNRFALSVNAFGTFTKPKQDLIKFFVSDIQGNPVPLSEVLELTEVFTKEPDPNSVLFGQTQTLLESAGIETPKWLTEVVNGL